MGVILQDTSDQAYRSEANPKPGQTSIQMPRPEILAQPPVYPAYQHFHVVSPGWPAMAGLLQRPSGTDE